MMQHKFKNDIDMGGGVRATSFLSTVLSTIMWMTSKIGMTDVLG
jgi:hypothetical protein